MVIPPLAWWWRLGRAVVVTALAFVVMVGPWIGRLDQATFAAVLIVLLLMLQLHDERS